MSRQETYQILLSSNSSEKPLRLAFPRSILTWTMVGFGIFGSLLVAIIVDYANMRPVRAELLKTRDLNVQIVSRLSEIDGKVNRLENDLNFLNKNSKKIKAIVKTSERLVRPIESSLFTEILNEISIVQTEIPESQSSSIFKFLAELKVNELLPPSFFRNNAHALQGLSSRLQEVLSLSEKAEQKHLAIIDFAEEQQFILQATPSIKPTYGWYSSHFGLRIDPFTRRITKHNGVDIAGPEGTPVMSAADGIVRSVVNDDDGYGWMVIVDHGYGVETRYSHVSKVFVKHGQKVKRADVVAALGSTGRSTGPHLHYEVRISGQPVDPTNYIIESN